MVKWYDAKETLPPESGQYICFSFLIGLKFGTCCSLSYSSVYKTFNARDSFTEAEADAYGVKVNLWCYPQDLGINVDMESVLDNGNAEFPESIKESVWFISEERGDAS